MGEEYDEFIHTSDVTIREGLRGVNQQRNVTKKGMERGRRANSIFDFVPKKLRKVDGYNSGEINSHVHRNEEERRKKETERKERKKDGRRR